MRLPSWPVLIGVTVIIVATTVVSIMHRLGSFKPVVVERVANNGPYVVVAREHLGAYHKIAAMISEIETWTRSQGEPCTISFGEYSDDPKTTDEDRLRSRGGCVLSSAEKAETLRTVLPAGTSISTIEITDALVAVFEGSPSIGPIKVYPKVLADMKTLDLEMSGPVLELYEVTSPTTGRTRYVFPVKNIRR